MLPPDIVAHNPRSTDTQPCSRTARLLVIAIGVVMALLTLPSRAAAQTGNISGAVTDGTNGAGIPSVSVWIYNSSGGFVSSTTTSVSGTYMTGALPAGTYFLRTSVSDSVNYIGEAYGDIPCVPSCNPITNTAPIVVTAGNVTAGVNFALSVGGMVSGVVTSTSTGLGVGSVTVSVFGASGTPYSRSAITQTNGAFTVAGLPTGTYYVETVVAAGLNYINEVWPDVPCTLPCSTSSGTTISVTAGATTPSINFGLTPGASITGRVSDAITGASLFNVVVQARTPTGTILTRRLGFSNTAGNYVINGLPPGTYYVNTVLPSNLNYIPEAWNNVPCVPCTVTATTPVTVAGTATAANINFALLPGTTILGTVTSERTGAAVSGATVSLYSSNGTAISARTSSASGGFSFNGLPAGLYFAKASATGFASELFLNRPCVDGACLVTSGTPIVVGSAVTVGGINFTLGPARQADVAIDFGPSAGVWRLSPDGTWQSLHGLSPTAMVTGDIDGNGTDDLVLNFGPGVGVWAWMNHASWQPLHLLSPSLMAAGDFNGDGVDDLAFVFAGLGVWRWNTSGWVQLHPLDATVMTTGQLDGTGGDELIVDFAGNGLWVFANGTTWSGLHGGHALTMTTADLDGSGRDELIVSFPGAGLWAYRNNANWSLLHGLNPTVIAQGRLDANQQRDLVLDFGANGIWMYRNDSTWTPLHAGSGEGLVLADRDGNGVDEILVDFGVNGLWQHSMTTGWTPIHAVNPEGMAAGTLH